MQDDSEFADNLNLEPGKRGGESVGDVGPGPAGWAGGLEWGPDSLIQLVTVVGIGGAEEATRRRMHLVVHLHCTTTLERRDTEGRAEHCRRAAAR